MGRQSRRLVVRLAAGASVLGAGLFLHTRWQLRAGSAVPVSPASTTPARSRAAHVRHLEASSQLGGEPFDVLVVGGSVQGLYTAVDAAQRGLRVALVEAGDYGSGVASQGASLQPGPFAFVQRALRQRDTWWLRRAAETMRETTIWENVCPEAIVTDSPLSLAATDGTEAATATATATTTADTATSATARLRTALLGTARPPALRTLIPALHAAELIEFGVAACVSTLLSPLCGPWRPHWLVPPQHVAQVLPGMQAHAQGGVRCCDIALHGVTATCALLRTAEALGVTVLNYAPLQAVSLEAEAVDNAQPLTTTTTTTTITSSSAAVVVATVEDALTRRSLTLRARTLINCGEAWADQVRALCPGNAQTTTPSAFSHYSVQSYLVVPRGAVSSCGPAEEGADGAQHMDSLMARLHRVGAEALQVCSTLYSFSAVFVLPWVNDCVLLGPCFSPLPKGHAMYGTTTTTTTTTNSHTRQTPRHASEHEAIITSSDGFRAQRERVQMMLKSCGVVIQPDRVLSCLSHVVPVLAAAQDVPWTSELLRSGYHVDVATTPVECDADGSGVEPATPSRALPFVHVYGGTLLQSRLIAAAAVDAAIHRTGALDGRKSALTSLHSRTSELALCPAFAPTTTIADNATTAGATADPMVRLRHLITDTHAERITDVLFRRTQVAYTSPAEAMQASLFVADALPSLQSAARTAKAKEAELARRAIRGVAVRGGA